ncbi:hypothetical protein Zmor_000306 [Zophobas morio]|uniref:Uncharacterized protein n=1 Tax=Zophobas morio TaxID=2755281 RepID=A0AA38MRL9_9CUCU|nr:hypothetical protein Zmor_000306 [Zophobas morio]
MNALTRSFLYVLCISTLVLSTLVIGCGVLLILNQNKNPTSLDIPVIVSGVVIFLVSFFASCTALKDHMKQLIGLCLYVCLKQSKPSGVAKPHQNLCELLQEMDPVCEPPPSVSINVAIKTAAKLRKPHKPADLTRSILHGCETNTYSQRESPKGKLNYGRELGERVARLRLRLLLEHSQTRASEGQNTRKEKSTVFARDQTLIGRTLPLGTAGALACYGSELWRRTPSGGIKGQVKSQRTENQGR